MENFEMNREVSETILIFLANVLKKPKHAATRKSKHLNKKKNSTFIIMV